MAKKNQNDDAPDGDDSFEFEEESADETDAQNQLNKTTSSAGGSTEFDLEDIDSTEENSLAEFSDADQKDEEEVDPSKKTVVVEAGSATVDIAGDEDAGDEEAEGDDFEDLPSPEETILQDEDDKFSAINDPVIHDTDELDLPDPESDDFDDLPSPDETILQDEDGKFSTINDSVVHDTDELESDEFEIFELPAGTSEIEHIIQTTGDIRETVESNDKDGSSVFDFAVSVDDAGEIGQSEEYDSSFEFVSDE